MQIKELPDLTVILDKQGAGHYQKVSYPIRYGRYSEILTPDYLLQYNQNRELKFIQGRNRNWPHPAEWLKRTIGDDWVYYFSGGYTSLFDSLGEYYLPCLPYPSNSLWNREPFQDSPVRQGIEQALDRIPDRLSRIAAANRLDPATRSFLEGIGTQGRKRLREKARTLFSVLQARVTVLPPDSRHVDYEVLPLIIADGCLYQCGFCRIKTGRAFAPRSRKAILEQIAGIKALLGPEIRNYNSLFLGQHDALNCSPDLIEFAACQAYQGFGFSDSFLRDACLFFFGSADSFLNCPDSLFRRLQDLPYKTYINLGLESVDQATLNLLQKPLEDRKAKAAFQRSLEINREFPDIEITVNFVLNHGLPENHWTSLQDLTRAGLKHYYPKGAVYLSPLSRSNKQKQLRVFKKMKRLSRLPMYLYLIQRL